MKIDKYCAKCGSPLELKKYEEPFHHLLYVVCSGLPIAHPIEDLEDIAEQPKDPYIKKL